MRRLQSIALAIMFSVALGTVGRAQQPPAPKPAEVATEVTSLKVQVVLSRYQGDKKISSFPYTFSVNADGHSRAELRMGSQLPVVVTVQGTPTAVFKDVGTTIMCTASPVHAGEFRLELTVSDSSVYDETAKAVNGPQPVATSANPLPALRSFSSSNTLTLKDGQSSQFTTATDRITGEVTKADVTLTVAK